MQIRIPCSHIKQHIVKSHARKNPIVKYGVLRNRQLFAFGLKGAQHFYSDFLIAILAFSHKTMPSFVIGSNQVNLRAVSPPSPKSRHRKRQLPGKAQLCQVLTTDLLKRLSNKIRNARLSTVVFHSEKASCRVMIRVGLLATNRNQNFTYGSTMR